MFVQKPKTTATSTGNVVPVDSLTFRREFSIELAREAGAIIKRDFSLQKKVEIKEADNTPVTATDKEINGMVISAIKSQFPKDDVFAEEGNHITEELSRYTWVCDPLDGTKEFIKGSSRCLFSLALTECGRPIVGVTYNPFTDQMLSAEFGRGAFLNAEGIKLSNAKTLRGTTVGVDMWEGAQFNLVPLEEMLTRNGVKLANGPIVFMGAAVALGELSAFVHPARMSWDSAASKIIIEEAGGRVTDPFGNNQRYDGKINGCLMSNGAVHGEMLNFIRRMRKDKLKL